MALKQLTTTLIFVLFIFTNITAQQFSSCYMNSSDEATAITQHLALKESMLNYSFAGGGGVYYIPVKFHLVADDEGLQRVQIDLVLELLCQLNEHFTTTDYPFQLQFYLKEGEDNALFSFINSTSILIDPAGSQLQMQDYRDEEAVNIWLVDDQEAITNIGGYFSSSRDDVVLNTKFSSFNELTLSHTMAHFFKILHTYGDHNSTLPYSITAGEAAPDSTELGYWLEFADGSNCETTGDFLCDTPAEYYYLQYFSNCIYPDNIQDPLGQAISPDLDQIMGISVTNSLCLPENPHFSYQQMEVAFADYNSPERDYIRTESSPLITEEITEHPSLISIEDEVNPSHVTLEWTPVENASHYFVQLSRLPSFSNLNFGFMSDTTSFTLMNELEEDTRYYWRVIPFNAYRTCYQLDAGSESSSFNTNIINATNDINNENYLSIYPNPTSGRLMVDMKNESISESFFIKIRDLKGAVVAEIESEAHNKVVDIDVSNLSAGVYFLHIVYKDGTMAKKGMRRIIIE